MVFQSVIIYPLNKTIVEEFNSNVGKANFKHLDTSLFEDAVKFKIVKDSNGHCYPNMIDYIPWYEGISPILCKDDM